MPQEALVRANNNRHLCQTLVLQLLCWGEQYGVGMPSLGYPARQNDAECFGDLIDGYKFILYRYVENYNAKILAMYLAVKVLCEILYHKFKEVSRHD